MRNIKITIAFDGTNYSGWQRQADHATIQGTLEEKIAVLVGEKVVVHGAGRTDAGVHAKGMVANFQTSSTIPCDGFLRGVNSMLPDDVRVVGAEDVAPGFHARLSAIGKRYIYQISVGAIQMPEIRLYWHHERPLLDLEKIRACLPILEGEHDFSSFEAVGSRDKSVTGGRGAVRRIHSARLRVVDESPLRLQILIAGNGFLRHMVRNIVGTALEVGKGKISLQGFAEILRAKDRSKAGPTAPAKGLTLDQVYY